MSDHTTPPEPVWSVDGDALARGPGPKRPMHAIVNASSLARAVNAASLMGLEDGEPIKIGISRGANAVYLDTGTRFNAILSC